MFSLSFAGHETTTGLIGNTVRRLLEDRSAGRTWSAAGPDTGRGGRDPPLRPFGAGLAPGHHPAGHTGRRDLPEGARLFLWLAAAGRDAEGIRRPTSSTCTGDAERHLAFGKGLHYCLGANLGKLETQIAVAELAHRYPRLRLAPDQRLTFHPNISFRGPQVLKVRTS